MQNQELLLSVSDFIALTNQTLEYAYPSIAVEGEVGSFKVNQGKYVFFDLKDAGGSIGCFMTVWQLRLPIEDGMNVIVVATPKLTQWGKFSLTVRSVRPSGEGALKKSYDILKAKLEAEGLFADDRKRTLPAMPQSVGVVSSVQAAGYADFIKILGDRFGGLDVDVAHVQVQGAEAADQIIRAIQYFNQRENPPEVIVIVRGGGSADDLAVFNDEQLVRTVAASRVPVLTGIGHEVDESLVDLAADVRASTPSNAAQLLVPDRAELRRGISQRVGAILPQLERLIVTERERLRQRVEATRLQLDRRFETVQHELEARRRVLAELDPTKVLLRGYAIVRGAAEIGQVIEVETRQSIIKAEVQDVKDK